MLLCLIAHIAQKFLPATVIHKIIAYIIKFWERDFLSLHLWMTRQLSAQHCDQRKIKTSMRLASAVSTLKCWRRKIKTLGEENTYRPLIALGLCVPSRWLPASDGLNLCWGKPNTPSSPRPADACWPPARRGSFNSEDGSSPSLFVSASSVSESDAATLSRHLRSKRRRASVDCGPHRSNQIK